MLHTHEVTGSSPVGPISKALREDEADQNASSRALLEGIQGFMNFRKPCLIALGLIAFASYCGATPIGLPNASFESPDFADGSGLVFINPGLVFGWIFTGPIHNTQFGIIDPDDYRFLGGTGNTKLLPSPAEGYQYAVLGGSAGSVSSIQNPAPLDRIRPFTRYSLDIAAINEFAQNFGSRQGTLQLSLMAGSTLVASSNIAYDSFDFGQMRLLETSFTTGNIADSRVGRDLNIRVTYTADSAFGSNGHFDNLVLTATPTSVPEPPSITLVLFAIISALVVCNAKHRRRALV